jgi:hypothetical protein
MLQLIAFQSFFHIIAHTQNDHSWTVDLDKSLRLAVTRATILDFFLVTLEIAGINISAYIMLFLAHKCA